MASCSSPQSTLQQLHATSVEDQLLGGQDPPIAKRTCGTASTSRPSSPRPSAGDSRENHATSSVWRRRRWLRAVLQSISTTGCNNPRLTRVVHAAWSRGLSSQADPRQRSEGAWAAITTPPRRGQSLAHKTMGAAGGSELSSHTIH